MDDLVVVMTVVAGGGIAVAFLFGLLDRLDRWFQRQMIDDGSQKHPLMRVVSRPCAAEKD
ncbi:MAG TPA: hypothetical protein VGF16_17975 [Bryobacteraceae bacterium]